MTDAPLGVVSTLLVVEKIRSEIPPEGLRFRYAPGTRYTALCDFFLNRFILRQMGIITTLARIFIHVVCQFNSILFATQH